MSVSFSLSEEDSGDELRLSIEFYDDAICIIYSEGAWSIDAECMKETDSPLDPLIDILGVEKEDTPCTESAAVVAILVIIDYFARLSESTWTAA